MSGSSVFFQAFGLSGVGKFVESSFFVPGTPMTSMVGFEFNYFLFVWPTLNVEFPGLFRASKICA